MNKISAKEEQIIQKAFEELLESCEKCKNDPDAIETITRAFKFANLAHQGARRKSGEPYILHPIAVARIVAKEIGLGTKSIVSSLLHDVVEDTDYKLEDIETQFGGKIANIIDGLTKINTGVDQNSSLQAETFRKILLTLSDDIRVIFIKLADRLHNMRTLGSMAGNKQLKIAGETLFLYAPLAHRLGLYAIKTELEDLSFKYENPKVYNDLENRIAHTEKITAHFLKKFIIPIAEKLNELEYVYEITGRPKSIYSVWTKMQKKNISFEEVYDILAIRIVFKPIKGIPEKNQCWNIYSLITDIYTPKPDRIRDWVSNPKANGYEALHITVMGPHGRWVEVQIRTSRMDDIAERGFAAHYKYKEEGGKEGELDRWIKNIRELLINNESNAIEFLDDFKLNLFASEIIAFTPKGKIISLPKGASALDFAFEIHTDIGKKAIGAKVNHKLVPVSHKLQSGDQVEILTSDKAEPQKEWFDYVITAKAKSNLKSEFKADRKVKIEKGKQMLESKLNELRVHPNSHIFRKLLAGYEVQSKDDLYHKIGSKAISIESIKKVLKRRSRRKNIRYWELQFLGNRRKSQEKPGIDKKKPLILNETEDPDYILAKCCNPIPGDEVVGYLYDESTIFIHKAKCPNALKLMSSFGEQIIKAEWTTHKIMSFLERITMNGIDRIGIVNEITNVISKELSVNMRSVNVETHDGIFEGLIDLYVHNTEDLNNLIMNLGKIKGVELVKRVEKIEDSQ